MKQEAGQLSSPLRDQLGLRMSHELSLGVRVQGRCWRWNQQCGSLAWMWAKSRTLPGLGRVCRQLGGQYLRSAGPASFLNLPDLDSLGSLPVLSMVSLFMSALSPQRDLDFTIDLDFKGQLCELSCSTDYRMR